MKNENYEKIENDFKRLAKNNQLSHAYLFFGENEEEIFLFAKSLANFLENGIFEESTGLLQETLIILPDEKSLPAGRHGVIGIDAIRSLKNFLWQKSVDSKSRIAIIKGAQNLTPEAQNAALKIAEEPPESVLIIFIAKSSENLLQALNSRLQKIYFSNELEADRRGLKSVEADLRGKELEEKERGKNANNIVNEIEIDQFFENLIDKLKKDPIKNSQKLKEALKSLTLMKQFNTNKRLQIRALSV